MLAEPDHAADEFDILFDVIRYEAAVSLMRPLAEGLALFAEFDVVPGQSDAISTPLSIAYFMFHEVDANTTKPYEGLTDLLAHQRLGLHYRERKANLLVQPFTCADGGYLPGYMLVKNLWLHMLRQQQCRRFWDKDVFLSYLESFFYNDYGWIATILAPETSEYRLANSIAVYFQERLNQFIETTTDESIERFEAEVIARDKIRYDSRPLVPEAWPGSDAQMSVVGRRRLQQLFDQIHDTPNSELERMVRTLELWVAAQRELMCIGSFNEHVRVNTHGMVHIGGTRGQGQSSPDFIIPTLALAADEGVPPQEGDGLVEFFIAPTSLYRAMAVSMNGHRVASRILSPNVPAQMEEQFKSNMLTYTADPETRTMWTEVVARVLQEHGLDGVLQHYRGEIARIADDIYLSRALLFTSDDDLEPCLRLLKTNGLFEALGRDVSLVRGLASLSMAASVHPTRDFVEEILSHASIDLSLLLEKLSVASDRHRFPLVRQNGPVLISYL